MSGRVWGAIGLAAAAAVALGIRAIGFQGVFVGDEVLLAIGDGHYHARLALYSLANFPAVLTFDPYINHPDGAAIPSIPVLAWLAAALARALGGGEPTLARVLAWWSPAAGALTTIPVYLAARAVAGRAVAVGAAFLVALLPVLATASHVGNADHHAVQALLGATGLWLLLRAVHPDTRGARLAAVAAGLVVLRLAILTVWSGSLLYVGLADGLLLLAAAWTGRRALLVAEAWSAGTTAALALPVVLWFPVSPAGPYSAVALSLLHVCALAAVAATAAGTALLEARRPGRRGAARLAGLVATAAAVAAAALLVPGLRRGLVGAFDLFGMDGSSGTANLELLPLLPVFGQVVAQSPLHYFGWFAWLIPAAPLAALWPARDPRRRVPACVLAAWCAVLGALALRQVRFGADFAPAAAVAFALGLAALTAPLAPPRAPRALRPALALGLGLAALWPAIADSYLPGIGHALGALVSPPRNLSVVGSPGGSLIRFLQRVRALTPETSGFLGDGVPEYGVLCRANLGHPLHYVARRASAADGFQHVVGPENFALNNRFFGETSERRALAIARRLRARYVVTAYFPGQVPGSMEARLQSGGLGSAEREPLAHFRLVTEGPRGGRPLGDLMGLPRPERVVPYRLFEIVAGALLEVEAPPGTPVSASLTLRTPFGRHFTYRVSARADDDGIARLRVPYPSEASAPVAADGPWLLRVGNGLRRLRLSEADVREGVVVRVSRDRETAPSRRPAAAPERG